MTYEFVNWLIVLVIISICIPLTIGSIAMMLISLEDYKRCRNRKYK